ncbi:MAG TPA: SpoIIE family protein phosphatase [Labilithrix sp.]|nr:SpoIIE family protein phosphatase [Labilithrix sp.]
MRRILLLVEHTENRRLLAEWLALNYEVLVPESPTTLDVPFDLGIVDAPSLERYGRWIEAIKSATHPVFLPFLAVIPRRGMSSINTGRAWERVDELIVSPVEKQELLARVENLLRGRALSLANAALRERLELELERARIVQCGLLPREAPSLRGFDLAAQCLPAREVGGDFYDWQAQSDEAVLTVGDVMGKGIPAALLAATVRAVLRALAHQNPPSTALDLLRETLCGDLERTASFVTLFHAHLRAAAHEVRYVDAGHGHALVRRSTGLIEHLERGGRPVGFPAAGPYRESALRLDPGDVLLVYSDGLCEGRAQLPEQLLAEVEVGGPASAIVEQLIERAPKEETIDDVTVLVLKCTG